MNGVRTIMLLLALALTVPAAAQSWEVRGGIRAGLHAGPEETRGLAAGGELWVQRRSLAFSAGIDRYDIVSGGGVDTAGTAGILSLDANYARPRWWIGMSAQGVLIGGRLLDSFAPNAGIVWPAGRRQIYLNARYHNVNFREFRDRYEASGVMLLVGFRSAPLFGPRAVR